MSVFKNAYLESEIKRWMAPNAHLFVRPDWRRHVTPGSDLSSVFALYEQKYSPEQPRVPAGSREGGQWTNDGANAGRTFSKPPRGNTEPTAGSGRSDPRVLSDATQDNYYKPGTRVAARLPPGRAAECQFQYRQDTFICNLIGTRSCWAQAAFRLSQCLIGGYVPPLYH